MSVNYLSAWLVLAGTAELESGGQIAHAVPGQWLIGGPGPRAQRLSEDVRLLSVLFRAHWPSGDPLFPQGLPLVFDAAECPQLERIGRRIDRVIERHLSAHTYTTLLNNELPVDAYLRIQEHLPGYLRELIGVLRGHGVLASGEKELDPRIAVALDILEGLPLDGTCVPSELAARSGLSLAHLDRLFLTQVGRMPKQHFDRRRLNYAEETLVVPGARVKEAAADLGFDSMATSRVGSSVSTASRRARSRNRAGSGDVSHLSPARTFSIPATRRPGAVADDEGRINQHSAGRFCLSP